MTDSSQSLTPVITTGFPPSINDTEQAEKARKKKKKNSINDEMDNLPHDPAIDGLFKAICDEVRRQWVYESWWVPTSIDIAYDLLQEVTSASHTDILASLTRL